MVERSGGLPRVARSGIGFDVHAFAVGDPTRPLWLGGVRHDDDRGLAGHSDGDAVCHALADALLGAAALGDIGLHFPEDDEATAGIGGVVVLSRSAALVRAAGFSPVSVDVTVIADRPNIASRRDEMRVAIAGATDLPMDAVSVKGTRPEAMGLTGDGVACLAIAVIV